MQNSPINFDLPKHLKNLEKRISVVENRRPGTIYLDKKIVTKDPETGVETVFGDLSDYGEDRTGIKQWVNDVKPPEVVTAPWVTANLGVFSISWDGATASGDPMDADFKNLNVYGNDGTSTKMVGVLSNKDEVAVVTDATYGTPWVFWFTSVDFNGNESTPSASSDPKELTPLVESPDISEAIDAVYNKIQEDFTKSMVAANGKNRIWHTPDAPVADPNAPFIDGDTWFDTNDGNKIYIWKSLPAPAHWEAAVLDSSALDDKITDAIAEAKDQSDVAIETANGKNKAWHSPTQPTGTSHTVGDLWFDTANDNRISRWNGTAWVLEPIGTKAIAQSVNDAITDATTKANTAKTTADGKNTNYYSSTTPTAPTGGFKAGDTWFDTANGNRISRWSGTAWVLAPIGEKAIAQTVLDSITTAQNTATSAQTSANGKNTNYYSASAPTAPTGGFKVGDTWFNSSKDNQINRWTGTAWSPVSLGSAGLGSNVITAIDNAKLAGDNAQIAANQVSSDLDATKTDFDTKINATTSLANTAQSTADTAKTNAATAQSTADTAKANAATAQSTADTAKSDAATASGIAGGKADVLIQSTAPATAMRKSTTLWIDTTSSLNTPKRWNGTAWVEVTDKAAKDAATAAATAQTAANNAQTAANNAQSTADTAKANAATAQTAANNAQATADTAKTNAATAQTAADAANAEVDKLWSSVKRAYYWAGDTLNGVTASSNMAIVNVNDAVASSSVLRKTGVGSTAYFDGEPLPFDNSVLYKITAKVRVVTAGTTPASPSFYVGVHAWKANATGGPGERVSNTGVVSTSSAHYFAAGPDPAPAVGEWVTVTGYFQGSVATGAGLEHKDITDPGQMIEGTKYVSPMVILDYQNGNGTWDLGMIAIDVIPAELQSQIVLAQSAANAAQASANAAQTAAGNAQSSADSAMTMAGKKSTVLYATTVPVGTGTRVDDIWRQRDATDQVIGEWRWTGSAWQKITLTTGVFSNLDAGLLTAGTIQADRIGARTITAEKIKAKELTANEIKTGTLTSASGVFGTVDASIINAGTINSDRLNANDIRAKFLQAGKITADDMVTGTITAASGIIANIDASKITVNEMDGKYIKANTILASRLAVTDFLNYNPNMLAQSGDWDLTGGTTIVASSTSADDKRFSFPLGSPVSYAVPRYYSDVLPGDKILVKYTPQSTSASSVLELYWQSDSPAASGILHTSTSSATANITPVIVEFTVPAKTNRIKFGLRTKTTNTAVVFATTFVAQKMTGGTLIEDGAITTEKIKVGAITAGSGIIASLDAGKITTGELDGTFIKAGTVLADRLIVSATDNLNRDPNFNFPDTMWLTSTEMGAGPERWSTDIKYAGGSRSMVLTQRPQGSNQSSYAAVPTEFYEVIPGDSYSVSSMVYSDTGTDANLLSVSQQVYFYNSSKNILSGAPGNQVSGRTNAVDWVTGQWNKVGGTTTLTVPEGAAYMRPRLTVYKNANVTPGTRKYYIGAISVMRAMDGTLITPEAITTPHIKTGAITAESGIIASLDAGKINTGSMHGKYIEAGTLLASTIAVRDNMNLLPNITYEAESWTLSSGATIIDSSLSAEKRRFNFPATALAQALSPDVQVIPGEKIKIECKTYGTSATQNLELCWFGRDGKGAEAGSAVLVKSTTANETLVVEWEVPSTVFSVRFSVRVPATTPVNTAVTGAYSFTARKMTGGVLIENGAVDADKIAANSITADNGKIASIDASKITVGELNGKLIKSGTVMSNSLVVGDFQNYATIDATRGVNVTNPAEWATDSEGEWTKSKVGAGSYLFFMDRGGPIPFKTGEKFRVSFTGYSTVNQTSTLCGYFYNGPDGGSITYSPTINVPMTTTATEYSYEVTVPNISSITGSGSWVFGFYNTTANNIRVKDVRILKMTDSTVITGDAILTRHIATDAVESRNIKANAVTADKIIAGAITTVKIDAEAVDASKIKANAVTTVKLDAEAVTADKIKANAITAIKIDANAVTSDKIMSKAVIADKIAVGAITADKLDADAITGKKITGGTITGTTINGGDLFMSSSDYAIEARTGGDGAYLGFRTPRSVTAGTIRATDEINIGGSSADTPTLTLRSPNSSGYPERGFIKMLSNKTANGGSNQPPIFTNMNLVFDHSGNGHVFGTNGLSLYGNGASLDIGRDSTSKRLLSTEVYDRTYSGNANMYITNNGVMGRSTSALKYKEDVQVFDSLGYEDALLSIETKTWVDKVEAKSYREYLEWEKTHPFSPIPREMVEYPTSEPKRHFGAIADEFDSLGLTHLVSYGSSGEVEGLAYDKIGVALISIIKKQRDKISVLEASLAETLIRIEALESK